MSDLGKERRDPWKYVAIATVAFVALACIAAFLTLSLTLISEIPFHHIFPH
jgi:hypothetical protein